MRCVKTNSQLPRPKGHGLRFQVSLTRSFQRTDRFGPVDLLRRIFSTPEAIRNFVNNIPLGRVGAPEEVARTILFLVSEASSYLVGETIEINGGMLME